MLDRGVTTSITGLLVCSLGCRVYDDQPLRAAVLSEAPQGIRPAKLDPPMLSAGAAENSPQAASAPPPLPQRGESTTFDSDAADAGPGNMGSPDNRGDVPVEPRTMHPPGMQLPMTAPVHTMQQMGAAGAMSPPAPPPAPVAKPSPECRGQNGYVSALDGHCYFGFAESVSWYVARDNCQQRSGHLATITTDEERAFVASIPAAAPAWIGLSRFGAVSFTWITQEIFAYTSWQADSPHALPESGVLTLPSTGLWTDRPPTELHPALCEIEPSGPSDIQG
jgi:predicted small integral membrane protein